MALLLGCLAALISIAGYQTAIIIGLSQWVASSINMRKRTEIRSSVNTNVLL
jgi:hypothetical protein